LALCASATTPNAVANITAAQGALGLAYIRARAGQPVPFAIAAAFWIAEIAAIMIKGPPGPALAIVTAGALCIADGNAQWLRGLRPVLGVSAMVAAIVPWLAAIEQATEGRFLVESLGRDLLRKLVDAQESHGAPPFAYLLMSLATFWPGSLLLVPALIRAWRRRDVPAERFLLAWLVPAWVLLELVPTKLPHYVLPLFPALALLAAAALVEETRRAQAVWTRRLDLVVKGLWAAVGIGLAALLIGLPLRFGGHIAGVGIVGAVVLLGLIATILRYRLPAEITAALFMAISLAFVAPAAMDVLPGLNQLWLSRGAAALVARHPPAGGAPLVAVGYSEPSLVFLLGTDLRLTTPRNAVEALAAGGEALVSSREDAIFRQAVSARGLSAQVVGEVAGLDYSNGQRMKLTLYTRAPG
jgi:4-amino-4-deoxy-L-arabinose transferase-like glycosyltransferase